MSRDGFRGSICVTVSWQVGVWNWSKQGQMSLWVRSSVTAMAGTPAFQKGQWSVWHM